MSQDDTSAQLLRIVVTLLGRSQFPEATLRKLVVPSSRSAKLLKAYNLCDGTRQRAEIAKACKIDKDNFNKAVNRWLRQGIIFELGQGAKRTLLHLYPLPPKQSKE